MDHTTRWMKTGGEGIPPGKDAENGNWLGLSPQCGCARRLDPAGRGDGSVVYQRVCAMLNRAVAVAPYPHDLAQVSFAVAGDVIPHEPVRAAASCRRRRGRGGDRFWRCERCIRRRDFGFVNMETPVAPAHSKGSKPFMFDAPVALPQALKASGIKIVSFANNHVMDQGWAGFAETREHLREVGLLFVGSGDTAATDVAAGDCRGATGSRWAGWG